MKKQLKLSEHMERLRIFYILNSMHSCELDDENVYTKMPTDMGSNGLYLVGIMKYLKGFWK